jgi:DNA-binding beta-propeller fold protein YncE
MCLSADKTKWYVLSNTFGDPNVYMVMFDLTNADFSTGLYGGFGTAVIKFDTSANAVFNSIVATPDGTKVLFTAQLGASSVYVMDAVTYVVTGSVSVDSDLGVLSSGLVVTPNSAKAYTNGGSIVCAIDLAALTSTEIINTSGVGQGLAMAPNGSHVYATTGDGCQVLSIDTATDTVLDTITVTFPAVTGLFGCCIDHTGDFLICCYVNEFNNQGLIIVNISHPSSLSIAKTIPGPTGVIFTPWCVATTSDGKYVYASSSNVAVYQSAGTPPIRQKPRDDNLALGAVRQRVGKGQPSSGQNSYRQGFRGVYW